MGTVVPFPERRRARLVQLEEDRRAAGGERHESEAELYILNLHRRRHPAGSKLPQRRASE